MTEDPIKLYVVVMSILLCVLAVVTYATWQQAQHFEDAIDRSKAQEQEFSDYATNVSTLCEQLKKSKLRLGYKTLIEQACNYNRIKTSKQGADPREPRIGTNGKEKRFRVEFRGSKADALTREKVARLCQTVEGDSRQILKTIEIDLSRASNHGDGRAGSKEIVRDDRYTGEVIFGLRYVE